MITKEKAKEILDDTTPFPEVEGKQDKEEVKIIGLKRKLFKLQGFAIEANATNPFHHNNYISLEFMVAKIQPLIDKYELLISHAIVDGNLITTISDIDSDEEKSSSLPLPEGSKPQDLGSAITYFKRYNIGALLNIITDKDDDGNASSQASTAPKATTAPQAVQHNPTPAPMKQSAPLGICKTCSSPLAESKNGGSPWCVACWKKSKGK